jgi:predicted metal-dependent hydrolase
MVSMREEATGKTGVPSETRQKPERPRDRLGRPLAWDAVNELELDDYDARTAEENHELGRAAVRNARYFPAHEAWETAWKQARGTGDEEFFKGLSQMGAGYVHLQRGNAHGAITLLTRAAGRVGRYPDPHRGIATAALTARMRADAERVRSGELVPGADATFDPPEV